MEGKLLAHQTARLHLGVQQLELIIVLTKDRRLFLNLFSLSFRHGLGIGHRRLRNVRVVADRGASSSAIGILILELKKATFHEAISCNSKPCQVFQIEQF